jgi:hypothetical protein
VFFFYNTDPFTAIHVDCLGSNLDAYRNSLLALQKFVANMSVINAAETLLQQQSSQSNPPTSTASPSTSLTAQQTEAVKSFLNVIGLSKQSCGFNADQFLEINDWNVESMQRTEEKKEIQTKERVNHYFFFLL